MAAPRTERLLNLVICLLAPRGSSARSRSASPCRSTPTAPPTRPSSGCSSATRTTCATWASRSRPGRTTSLFDDEVGYRIPEGRLRPPRDHLRLRRARRLGTGRSHLAARGTVWGGGAGDPQARGDRSPTSTAPPCQSSSRVWTPPSPPSVRCSPRCTPVGWSRSPTRGRGRPPPATAPAVGAGLVERPLVRRRARRRP